MRVNNLIPWPWDSSFGLYLNDSGLFPARVQALLMAPVPSAEVLSAEIPSAKEDSSH